MVFHELYTHNSKLKKNSSKSKKEKYTITHTQIVFECIKLFSLILITLLPIQNRDLTSVRF